MGMIGDFYVRLSAMTSPYTASLIEATDEGEAFAEANKTQMEAVKASNESGGMSFGLLGKAAVGIGAAFIGISAVSMKWATSFQSTMESIHTQAGVAQSQLGSLGNGVLSLAGQVGFSPDSLAEALYHIESSFASVGITGPTALNLLKIAAEGAAVGHANLVDVTNALDAAIASGIPGVQNYSQAMGVLNSIVGSGDMTMQDLANAFSTGALANVKSYGASITDVGAALAVFGDNNIRGQNAATDLRMSMQALQSPAVTTASVWLDKMGMSMHTLGDTMSKGGLLPALQLLHDKMTAIGVTSKTQGAVLTDLFGKKAGAGIVVLYDQLDRLKSKYPDLEKGAQNFGDAWAQTKLTVKQQLNEIGAGIQAAGIRFGQFLLPQAQKALTWITTNGATAASQLSKTFSQFMSGFSGAAVKVPVKLTPVAGAAPSIMGAEQHDLSSAAAAPQLTGWQQTGVIIRGVATDFERFGKDALAAGEDAVRAAQPVVQVLAGALGVAVVALGKVLASVVGPALEDVFGFLASHQAMVKVFAEVILGALVAKLLILKSIKAATAITDLATSIVKFPFGQVSQIGTAFSGLTKSAGGLKTAVLDSFGQIKSAVTGSASFIASSASKFAGAVESVGSAIGGAAMSWGGKLGSAVKGVMPTKLDAKLFLQSIKDVGSQAASTVAGWGGSIASAASSAASGLSSLATSAASAVSSVASSAWTGAGSALSSLGASIATAASSMWDFVTSSTAAAMSAGRAALAFVGEKIAMIGTAVAEGVASAAQWLLNAAMLASPLTWVVIAVVAVVGAFVLLWTKCSWFRDFWKSLWSDIKRLFDDAVSFVKGHVDLLVAILALPILPVVLLVQHWRQAWSDAKKLFDDGVSFVKTHVDLLVAILYLPILPLVLLLQHWRQVWADIKTATLAAWHFLDSDVIQPVDRVFTQDVPNALRTAGQTFSTVWGGIKSTVSGVWNWIWGNVLSPAVTWYSNTIGGALSTAKSLWNSFWGGVQTAVQAAWSVIEPIINTIKSAVSGVTSAINSVTGAASGIGGAVTGTLGKIGKDLFGLDDGGYVPGAKGAPMFAIVHGGEYMLSNDMLSGRAPIDNRAMAGVLSASSIGGGGGGGAGAGSALAVRAGGGGQTIIYQTVVQVAGSVISENQLLTKLQTKILQYNLRNSNNGLSLP